MNLTRHLPIPPGITAVTGSGGKTTLLETLGRELSAAGARVLLCTTTKILPFPGIPLGSCREELEELGRQCRLLCAGTPAGEKLGAPSCPLAELSDLFDYILAEADGSRGRPLKAHAPWEPVIPPGTGTVIQVLGASGFGRPIWEAAHRPERYAELAGVSPASPATAETAAAVLMGEGLRADILFVNQAERRESLERARELARLLGRPVWAGSLREGKCVQCW